MHIKRKLTSPLRQFFYEFPVNLHYYGVLRPYNTVSFAVWTWLTEHLIYALPAPFPRHFYKAEFRDFQNVCPRLISLKSFLERTVNLFPVACLCHVYKIYDDYAADIS